MRSVLAAAMIVLIALGLTRPASAQPLSKEGKPVPHNPPHQHEQPFDLSQLGYTYIKGTFSPEFEPPAPGTYTLPVVDTVSNHPVLDSNGKHIGLLDLKREKIAVISFIYTSCAETTGCPLAMGVLKHLDWMLAKQAKLAQKKVVLFSVSFDPERDTPERMAAVRTSLSPRSNWHFLTGATAVELQPLLEDFNQPAAKLFYQDGTWSGLFRHVLKVFLLDEDNNVRNIYSVGFLNPQLVMNDIQTLLMEKEKLTLHPPQGLPDPVPAPEENPLTRKKVDLGRRLFFDRRLSPNNTLSCAMCHLPSQGFTSNELRLAVGIHGQSGRRNAPSLYNVAYQRSLFHDGRAATLEEQTRFPLTNSVEMGNPSMGYVVDKVRQLPGYEELFLEVFGEGVSVETLSKALASYERTLLSANSPFDRWYFGGEEGAVTAQVKEGFKIFSGKGGCISCHTVGKDVALVTDQGFHNTGVASLQLIPEETVEVELAEGLKVRMPRAQLNTVLTPLDKDLGRYEVTQDPQDLWRYKTPSLRNVALTTPYMHNGALLTLEEVVDYYNRGGTGAEGQDPRIQPLGLTTGKKQALIAFLKSLTGDNVHTLARETYAHAELEGKVAEVQPEQK